MRYSLRDVPQTLLLRRPVECTSCGERFYRPMRQGRKLATVIAGVMVFAAVGFAAVNFGRINERIRQLLLQLPAEPTDSSHP